MRTKIGQIDIFASDEPNRVQSSFSIQAKHLVKDMPEYRKVLKTTAGEKNHFVIELNPEADFKTVQEVYGDKAINFKMADTLAHELGHVVAEISGDPDHQSVFGNRVRREKLAWNIARKIKPDVDPEVEKLAVGTYENNRVNQSATASIQPFIEELIAELKTRAKHEN